MQILTKVHLFRSPFTIYCIRREDIIISEDTLKFIGITKAKSETKISEHDVDESCIRRNVCKGYKLKTIALFLQPFIQVCLTSEVYRKNLINKLAELSGKRSETVFLKLILEPPDKEIIDYSWNERLLHLLWTRIEIENAFAWLSTLGGAYSALGDYFEHCAEEAGRISIRQYKLSKMLGDEGLTARSKLYSALAISQKGNLNLSRKIVREVAAFAHSTHDKRLNRMCQGVWAKLKYLRQLKKNSGLFEKHGFGDVKM